MIHHNHSTKGCQSNLFLFEVSHCLCLEGCYFIKKCYDNANTIKHTTNPDSIVWFFNLENQKLKYILQNKHDHCSCYVANSQLMQCKHMISFKKVDLSLIGKCWYQRNKINNSSYVGTYVSPRLKNNIPEID